MLFSFPIPPGLLSTNAKFIAGAPRPTCTRSFNLAKQEVALLTRDAMNRHGWRTLTGPVTALVVCSWENEKGGDYNCSEKGIVDAVVLGGALLNDKQIRVCTLLRHVGAEPGITVALAAETRSSAEILESALRMFDQGGDR